MFRRLLTLFIFTLSTTATALPTDLKDCASRIDNLPLRDHMFCLSLRMDEAFALVGKRGARKEAADQLEQIRYHLQRTISLTPSRFQAMTPDEVRLERLAYHRLQAETLLIVSQLEEQFLASRNDEDRVELNPKSNQLIARLQQVIGLSHQRFRK